MKDIVLSTIQKNILRTVQRDFPLENRPYRILAERVNMAENEMLGQLHRMRELGLIRRVGATFQAEKLGYVSTLIAARVPAERLEAFIAEVNSLPGVSHNYGRANDFNVWFTLTVPSPSLIEAILRRLRENFGIESIYSLPAVKIFKLNVYFSFDENDVAAKPEIPSETSDESRSPNVLLRQPKDFSPEQRKLIRQLQLGLPLTSEPFVEVAHAAGVSEPDVLTQMAAWRREGVIHRLGASVNYRKIGYQANAMMALDVDESAIWAAGSELAGYSRISHCYQRASAPHWPYNLYAMIHARQQREIQEFADRVTSALRPRGLALLYTTHEYKKSPVCYFTEDEFPQSE
jgi:siroheme decarboxylase